MNSGTKPPLYRKVNTTAHGVKPRRSVKYRDERHLAPTTMHTGKHNGRDYTPLFRFLLSRVGQPWAPTLQEAQARLDDEAPIAWLVDFEHTDPYPIARMGESSYYSKLTVDDDGVLRVIDPSITAATMMPYCTCCTHTFNGKPLVRKPLVRP